MFILLLYIALNMTPHTDWYQGGEYLTSTAGSQIRGQLQGSRFNARKVLSALLLLRVCWLYG